MEDKTKLNRISDEIVALTKADSTYKVAAWLIYVVMIIAAFLISLGNAQFDFTKLGTAQFWIDFSFTFGGGMLLKYAFGKWGDFEGHKHLQVVAAIKDLNNAHTAIKDKKLLNDLDEYIEHRNSIRKLSAIKNKTYDKLRKHDKSKKWLKMKECVLTQEALLAATDDIRKKELTAELDALNFDLDTYPIKYNKIRKDTLQTGFSEKGADDDTLNYSEMFNLFGKNIALTIVSVLITFILAVTSVIMEEFTLAAVFIFVTRLSTFTMNSYLGFSISKTGVEKVKLNILKKIYNFLTTFIEMFTSEVK